MNESSDLILTEKLKECPACGGERYVELPLPGIAIGRDFFSHVMEDILLVRCLACGHVYQKIRPSGELLDQFYKTSSEYAPFGHGRDAIGIVADRLRLEFINRFTRRESSILDFGGGSGRFALSARDVGKKAAVVELSSIGRDQCAQIGIPAFSDIKSIPESDQYDVISIIHVLEHVGFPIETLTSLSEALPPNGGIYIEVPNLKSLRARIFPLIAKRCPNDCWFRAFPSHLHGFGKKSLLATLKKAGLQPLAWMTYGGGFEMKYTPPSIPAKVVSQSDCKNIYKKENRISVIKRLKAFVKFVLFEHLLLGENLCVYCVKSSSS